jgi:hypothetical protein
VSSARTDPRRGSVLTKKPISPSTSVRPRPATGAPITTSSCPDQRASTARSPASSTVNGVVPSSAASARTCRASAGSIRSRQTRPRWRSEGGRGASVGSSSAGGAPASAPRQNARCFSSVSPARCSRCQSA